MAETEISADTDTKISAETDTKTDNFPSLVSTAETNRDRDVSKCWDWLEKLSRSKPRQKSRL